MKYFFCLILFFLASAAFSQTKKIESNIQKLDNSQFIIEHSSKASFLMKSPAALKLIKIGKPATKKLILALGDQNKTIMAHLVLCHIYFNHVSFAGPKEQIKNNETILKYYLGEEKGEGLIISESKNNNVFKMYIETKDQDKIIEYWKNKTMVK